MNLRTCAAAVLFASLLATGAAHAAYSPASTNGWFPIVGRGPGAAPNTQIRSDVWLFNPDLSAAATVTLVFHPAVSSGAPAGAAVSSAPIVLFPRETRFLPDVTSATVAAGDGSYGALEWVSDLPLLGTLHKYASGIQGTAGGYSGAIPASESMGARASATDAVTVLQVFGLHSGDASFTTALDVANTSTVALPVEVKVIAPDASILAASSYTIAAHSLLRAGNPFAGLAANEGLRVTVAVKENTAIPSGGVLAAATVTDVRSNDANVVLGARQSAGFLGSGPCTPDANSLCLNNGRFRVTAAFQSATSSGNGTAIPGTSDTGQFWFFSAQNVEMVVKVLNGCPLNDKYWVFAGGLTNVQVTLTVTDVANGTVKTYVNPINTAFQPIQDTSAFGTCP
jgi:hypothetical protein